MARKTSLLAYNKLATAGPGGGSLLSEMRWKVYDHLYRFGPLTGRELDAGLARPDETRTSYHKRLSELRALRLVEETGTKACSITGETAISWDVTDLAPDPETGHIVLQPAGEAHRARGRAHVKYLLDAERAALSHFLEELRMAHERLMELDPVSATELLARVRRIHASRKRWLEEDGRFPPPLLVEPGLMDGPGWPR